MNNLAFMRNLAGFDSGITNLSPEMLNLASPREQARSPDSKLERANLVPVTQLSVVLNESIMWE